MKLPVFVVAAITGMIFSNRQDQPKGRRRRNLKGPRQRVQLVESTWNETEGAFSIPVLDGAHGTMQYRSKGLELDYIFTGYQLEPNTNYELVIFSDPFVARCLGNGTSNSKGKLTIRKVLPTGDLHHVRIWLGPQDAFDCESRNVRPDPDFSRFLFPQNLLVYYAMEDLI